MSRFLVTGGTGMVGKALVLRLLDLGHQVSVLTRNPQGAKLVLGDNCQLISGDPAKWGDWAQQICGHDGVIHLAGQNVADKRWSKSFKAQLRDSRVNSTRNICQAILACKLPPPVYIGASAIGFYGDTGEAEADEGFSCSHDFFGDLCKEWENASSCLEGKTRRVLLRIGVVLKQGQGALAKMDLPIRWGLGGPMAGGQFFMSWIHLQDLVNLIIWALGNTVVSGTDNATAPEPERNSDLVRKIAVRLHRPALFPVPYFLLRMAVGEFAQFLCASQRIIPRRALEQGFLFQYPTLDQALDNEYGLA